MRPIVERDEDEILGKAYDGRLVRRLVPYLQPYRGRIAIALCMLIGTTLLDLVPPYLTGLAIDRYIDKHDASGLVPIVIAVFASLIVGFALRYGQNWHMQFVGQRVL